MLFGRSVFQTILTRLDVEAPDDTPAPSPSYRVAGLTSGFVMAAGAAPDAEAAGFDDPYRSALDGFAEEVRQQPGDRPEPLPPVMPAELARLSEQEVAEDLGILPTDSHETLAERRRTFARHNHPDSVDALFRDRANTRMMLANMLIDRAQRLTALR
ncbi:hypothetical protein [Rhizobium sp. SGZ-381]|uniref:hypothetical protein n=1 Tax=Rhizobium sp. SGZ-381 TaxID=3342800 RepID=UPI0036727B79